MNEKVVIEYSESLGIRLCENCVYCENPELAARGLSTSCLHPSALINKDGRYSYSLHIHRDVKYDSQSRDRHCGSEGAHYERRST